LIYIVLLSNQVEKFYEKLQKSVRDRVREALISLENTPHAGKPLHGELRENYSLRVGKLRIIYHVSERGKTVFVIAIGPRKTIYK
jgi:mRNA-degrading endonuclease RelE of RelBE toxin-antitoxin system